MAKKRSMTEEEAADLFSRLDESGLIDTERKASDADGAAGSDADAAAGDGGESGASGASVGDGGHARRHKVDPLSAEDPSGSKVGETINRTALLVIVGVLVFVVGMQVVYGVNRRLNTANLSERADAETVEQAMRSGVEWGNGFTQFPTEFTVDEANEKSGTIEVTVVDTDSSNELELLSNSQIQASALATNALLNDKINRVVYNVDVLVNDDGDYQHDHFFGFIKASGQRRAILTFIWTKSTAESSSNIDWELKIIGMDEATAEAIQEQVNSVSSLTETPGATQGELDEDAREQERDQALHGEETFLGGAAEKTPESVLEQER